MGSINNDKFGDGDVKSEITDGSNKTDTNTESNVFGMLSLLDIRPG